MLTTFSGIPDCQLYEVQKITNPYYIRILKTEVGDKTVYYLDYEPLSIGERRKVFDIIEDYIINFIPLPSIQITSDEISNMSPYDLPFVSDLEEEILSKKKNGYEIGDLWGLI